MFWKFAQTMTIPSKDYGLIPFKPWGVQQHFIEAVASSIEDGVHEFVVLKGRQMGVTTVSMGFDAYWCLRHSGLQGQFSANSDENRDYFRDVLTEMYKTLPTKYKYGLRLNNRTGMAWANGSRLMFQTVGILGKVGRGRGLNFHHGTEMGEWRNPEAVGSLRAAFSERHPHRLFIWEGTAKGHNHFYDMWREAEHATTIKQIFLGWWRHTQYKLTEADKAFHVYWDGTLTADERAWAREIKRRWGVELTAGQWAWYRWKFAESMMQNELLMLQEYPTLPEHAFQASGQPFVGHAAIAQLTSDLDDAPQPSHYRYTFGPTIEQTIVKPTTPELAQLTVWEDPDPHGVYIVAADPAFGASAASDRYCCSVWRATKYRNPADDQVYDRLVQVASFVTTELGMHQFAWVTVHLAGTFMPSFFILELNGPGLAVWQELERLRDLGWGTGARGKVQDVMAGVNHYFWRRPDSMGKGAAWQFKTSPRLKFGILCRLRDQLMQGSITIREPEFVQELLNVRQTGDRFISGHAHDDRVMAAAMAVEHWSAQVLPYLVENPVHTQEDAQEDPVPAHERAVALFFRRIGMQR